jgi:hypothetical protein
MKRALSIIFFLTIANKLCAQDSTIAPAYVGKVTVIKDPRLDILAKKELEFNTLGTKAAKGYRLLVMNSNDREKVMAVRAKLLQQFPDQKVYMTFQFPYIKLKFGNFVEKPDAERFRDLLTRTNIVSTNVYVVPDVVEVKPDKLKKEDDQ